MAISSAFGKLHSDLNASFGEYAGWAMPAHYGDLDAECRALYESSAAFDLSAFGRIAVSGDDAAVLIENLLASDTGGLDDGRWVRGIVCDACGRLADIVRVGQTGRNYIILTSPGARHKIIELAGECMGVYGCRDVKIADQTEKTGMLGIYGPGALAAISHIIPMDISELEPGGMATFSVFFMQITAIRGSWLGVDGVEVFAGTGACKMAAGAIEKYHKREHIVPAGMECLEIALTEAAVPILLNGQPLPEILSPLSYGLGRHIDKNKAFLGKTGLDSLKPKRVIAGFATEDKTHTHKNLRLQYDGLEIGWTDRVVWSQKLGRTIGLAMIDAEMGDLKEEVQVHGDGVTLGGEIVELPFESSISGGIY